MEQRSARIRMLATMVVAFVVLLSAACGPAGMTSESEAPPTNAPAASDKGQELPTTIPTAAAESQVSPLEVSPLPTATAEVSEAWREIAESTALPDDTPGPGTEMEEMIALATADLAGRLGLPEANIIVGSVEEVVWPDASLGCPQPDMLYAQVLTPGFRVVLESAGATYQYHTNRDETVVLCENLLPPGTPSKGIDTNVEDGWPNQPLGDDVIIEPPAERKP